MPRRLLFFFAVAGRACAGCCSGESPVRAAATGFRGGSVTLECTVGGARQIWWRHGFCFLGNFTWVLNKESPWRGGERYRLGEYWQPRVPPRPRSLSACARAHTAVSPATAQPAMSREFKNGRVMNHDRIFHFLPISVWISVWIRNHAIICSEDFEFASSCRILSSRILRS
jgi:hypothetical protein